MRTIKKYIGITLIVLGVVIFTLYYFLKIDSNALLLTGLAAVLLGVIGQIWSMKRENDGAEEMNK
jgi:drug/metabolite transporter (DMT)-like permease